MFTHDDCQSCGLPLAKDPKGGGTYSDGRKSRSYCSDCYSGGRFTHPELTVDRMRELSAGRLHQRGYPWFFARFLVRNLHKLERWDVSRPLAQGHRL